MLRSHIVLLGYCHYLGLTLLLIIGSFSSVAAKSQRFFQPDLQLSQSVLGKEIFNRELEGTLVLLIDQGLLNVADVSDVFYHLESQRYLVGLHPEVLPVLLERVRSLPAKHSRDWMAYKDIFVNEPLMQPIAEGILKEPTRMMKLPHVDKGDPYCELLSDLAPEIATALPNATDILQYVQSEESPWVQDYLIPFTDQSLGVPAHLSAERFKQSQALIYQRTYRHIGGEKSFTLGAETNQPLSDLMSRGYRFRQLRSFVEGGNIIFLKDHEGHLRALLGEDSVILTREAYGLSQDETLNLIAADFNMARQDLVVIQQPDYHIDLYLRAAGNGKVFVGHQGAGEMMLQGLIHAASDLNEALSLKQLLKRFQRTRKSLFGKQLAGNLQLVRDALREQGFDVIDYPSLYFSHLTTGEYIYSEQLGYIPRDNADYYIHVNTLNNRYVGTPSPDGTTKNIIHNFVLSSGYSAIDRYLASFEQQHGIDHMHFIGSQWAGPESWGNKVLVSAGGVGCLSNL